MTKTEKEFSGMITSLLQTELCKDFDPRLLHGFMGAASEASELLNKIQEVYLLSRGASFTDR